MLGTATVYNFDIVSSRKVVFTFDLKSNESLRNEAVVHSGMALLLFKYPRAETYTVEYYGDWLFLTVVGSVIPNPFR